METPAKTDKNAEVAPSSGMRTRVTFGFSDWTNGSSGELDVTHN